MHYHSRFLSLLFVSGLIGSALPMSAQTFQVKATVSASTLDGTSTSEKVGSVSVSAKTESHYFNPIDATYPDTGDAIASANAQQGRLTGSLFTSTYNDSTAGAESAPQWTDRLTVTSSTLALGMPTTITFTARYRATVDLNLNDPLFNDFGDSSETTLAFHASATDTASGGDSVTLDYAASDAAFFEPVHNDYDTVLQETLHTTIGATIDLVGDVDMRGMVDSGIFSFKVQTQADVTSYSADFFATTGSPDVALMSASGHDYLVVSDPGVPPLFAGSLLALALRLRRRRR